MRAGEVMFDLRCRRGHGVGIGCASCGRGTRCSVEPGEFYDGLGQVSVDRGLVAAVFIAELQFHALQQIADAPSRQRVQVQHATERAGRPNVEYKQGLEPG